MPDPYRWMEDLESKETERWVRAEEELFRSFVGAVPERDAIRRRILELSDRELYLAPIKAGDRYFLTRITSTGVPAGLWVKEGKDAAPRLLLDPKSRGDGAALGGFAPSPDGRLVAYTLGRGQSRWLQIRVADAATGKDLTVPPLETHAIGGTPVWTPDGAELFFVRFEKDAGSSESTAPPVRPTVRRFRLDEPQPQRRESLVYEPPAEPGLLVSPTVSDDGLDLVLTLRDGSSSQESRPPPRPEEARTSRRPDAGSRRELHIPGLARNAFLVLHGSGRAPRPRRRRGARTARAGRAGRK